MSYLGFSTKWAASLAKAHHLDEEKQTELTYAIEVLTLNSLNVILTLTLGWILGVFRGTLICLLTVAAFRHNAGGGHSESPWRCALVTIIVFPLLSLMAQYVNTWQPFYMDLLSLISILVGFVFIFIYAPVDNPKAPIISPIRRKRLKKMALSIITAITAIILILRINSWDNLSQIQMCIVLSILWVSFNLTPIGHLLWCFIDSIGTKKERRFTG